MPDGTAMPPPGSQPPGSVSATEATAPTANGWGGAAQASKSKSIKPVLVWLMGLALFSALGTWLTLRDGGPAAAAEEEPPAEEAAADETRPNAAIEAAELTPTVVELTDAGLTEEAAADAAPKDRKSRKRPGKGKKPPKSKGDTDKPPKPNEEELFDLRK